MTENQLIGLMILAGVFIGLLLVAYVHRWYLDVFVNKTHKWWTL